MNFLTSITKKRLGAAFLLFIVFGFSISFSTKTYAAKRDYQDFICLFTAKERDCIHGATPEQIKKGEESGVAYGKTSGFTETGVKQFVALIGLHSRSVKDVNDGPNSTSRYFYKRVADKKNYSFLIRLKYTIPAGEKFGILPVSNQEKIHYQLEEIPYQKYNNSVNLGSVTITGESVKGDAYTNGNLTSISFYNERSGGDLLIEKQVVQKPLPLLAEVPYGSKIKIDMDLWYCGGQSTEGEDVDGLDAPRGDGTRVEYFTTDGKWKEDDDGIYDPEQSNNGVTYKDREGGIKYPEGFCEGDAAYKIGETTQVNLPTSQQGAQTESEQNINTGVVATKYTGSVMPRCHILDGWGPGSGSFLACITNLFYYLIFKPVAWFAWLMGQLFDFFIGYSLSDESYRHNFVQTAWQLVRDISNIFFIILMIWSGLAAVFNTSNVSYKKVIPTLIVNALIINFSLFATRLVIDASNVTARLFYNRMEVCKKDDAGNCTEAYAPGGYKSISQSIVSSFNPQKVIQNANLLNIPNGADFDPDGDTGGSNSSSDTGDFNGQQGSGAVDTSGLSRNSDEYAAYFGLVTLIMIFIAFATAMMFWKTAFMFLGRVIGLYVAMVFAPFAFLSRDIPLLGGVDGINYKSWKGDLVKYALLAPIFIFFLYIIHAFLQVDFIKNLGLQENTDNFFEAAMYVIIPMLIIWGLIRKGVGIAEKYAGEYGKMAQSFGTKVVAGAAGIAGGAALAAGASGLAYAGTRYGARLGRAVGRSRLGQWAATSNGRLARMTKSVLNASQTGTWDFRNTKFGQFAQKNPLFAATGVKMPGAVAGFGSSYFEGGLKGMEKRRQDKIKKQLEERVKIDYLTDDEAKALWAKKTRERADKNAEDEYFKRTNEKYREQSDQIKAKEDEIKAKEKEVKKELEQIEKNLLTPEEKKISEEKVRTLQEETSKLQKEVKEGKGLLETFKNAEASALGSKNKYKDSKEYKDILKEQQEKAEKDAKKKYGKVENVKDLQKALARDYAEELRNNSSWMKDGKKEIPWWMAIGAAVGGPIALERIQFEQDALDAATKSFIKDYGKSKGGQSKIDQYKEKLEGINKKIKEAIAKAEGKAVEDINLDDYSDIGRQEELVKKRINELRAQMDMQNEKYKKAAATYRDSVDGDRAAEKAFRDASDAKREAEDAYNEYKDLWKNKSETEKNVAQEEEKQKPKEDKK